MNIKLPLILIALLIFPNVIQADNTFYNSGLDLSQSNLPYSINGTITEDGDDVWDSGEYEIINYKIAAGENLSIEFFTSSTAKLHVFYGDFEGYQDVEETLRDLSIDVENDRLLAGSYTTDGFLNFTYTPSTDTDKNIAIFTLDTDKNIAIFTLDPENPPSMIYSIYSSIKGTIVQISTAENDSGFDLTMLLTVIVYLVPILFVGGVIYSLYKKRGSKTEEKVNL